MKHLLVPPRGKHSTRLIVKSVRHGVDLTIRVRKLDGCSGLDVAGSVGYCFLLVCQENNLPPFEVLKSCIKIQQEEREAPE